jgi:hypothetical protein
MEKTMYLGNYEITKENGKYIVRNLLTGGRSEFVSPRQVSQYIEQDIMLIEEEEAEVNAKLTELDKADQS